MIKSVKIVIITALVLIALTDLKSADQEKTDKQIPRESSQEKKGNDETLQKAYSESIVVTASRGEETYFDTTSSITLITRERIEDILAVSLGDALRYTPGVSIQQAGSIGKVTSLRIRGANSNQVLLLLDGIPLNDPALGLPNIAPLTVSSAERIEVLRGGHSPLYGSAASGGVVNIITQMGEGPLHFTFYGEGDYNSVYSGNIDMSGSTGAFSYYANYQTVRSDGQWTNDNYKNNTFNIKFGYNISDSAQWINSLHYIDSHIGIPLEVYGAQVWDENAKQDDLSFLGSTVFKMEPAEWYRSELSIAFFINRQRFKDPVDEDETGEWAVDFANKTSSSIINFHAVNHFDIGERDLLTLGLEYRYMRAMNQDRISNQTAYDENINNYGIYIQNRYSFADKLIFMASLRYDDFEKYGTSLNPRIALSFISDKDALKLSAIYSTSFRIPSFNELFYPYYGNPDLKPEESRNFEINFEKFLADGNLKLNGSLFLGIYEDLIGYNYDIWKADNIDKATINGCEISLDFQTKSGFFGSGGYTYLYTNDYATEKELLRRPKHQAYFNFGWKNDSLEIHSFARLTGKQLDNPVIGFPEMNDGYFVMDINVQYVVVDDVRIIGKITNLFDAEYCEVKGFPARGSQFFFGFSMR